jgi:hypothetical protein
VPDTLQLWENGKGETRQGVKFEVSSRPTKNLTPVQDNAVWWLRNVLTFINI